jgi:four helix bundle protein
MSGGYRELKVWQKAMELVYAIYEATRRFPKDEVYGLSAQLRRAAVSVPSNIAEGKGRATHRDASQFFCHARGSIYEVETQLLIAEHVGYVDASEAANLKEMANEVARMINGLLAAFATA